MKEELNVNEKKVLKAMIENALDEAGGDFGFTTNIKVKGLTKHQIAGYIGDLEKKKYISVYHEFDQFEIRKKTEKIFKNVEVYGEGLGFRLKKKF